LFFHGDDSSSVSHTGIYIGGGMMIDASSSNGKVVKRSVSSYWKGHFVNARRPW
ncbi:MAG: C40 family peptidase, partial [Erysipelotrichaceae bacterium]|nr:C40 family peptidase [Erysipelotrichaceae bacterium]